VAPTYLVEEFAHVIAVISHSQATFNQVGNSLSSPQLCSVSMGHGSLGQETNKLFFLFQGQSGRPSWRRLGFQCLLSAGFQGGQFFSQRIQIRNSHYKIRITEMEIDV